MLGKSGSIFLSILVHSTWACVEKFFQFKFKFIRDLQQCRAVAMDCFRSICNAASSSATWQPRFQWKTPQCREQKQCNCEPFLGHSQRRVSSYVYCGGSPLKDYGVSISPLASSLGPSTQPRPSRKNPKCPVFLTYKAITKKPSSFVSVNDRYPSLLSRTSEIEYRLHWRTDANAGVHWGFTRWN